MSEPGSEPGSELGLICLIALETPSRLDQAAALQALTRIAPRSDLEVVARDPGGGETGLAVRIDGQDYVAASVPGRMPAEICDMVRTGGMFWPGREQALERHGGFLALSAAEPAQGHGLMRAQAAALIRLAAALARTVPALGLVWPAAGTAVPAARLEQVPEQIQGGLWPVDIWIGFQLVGATRQGQRLIGARSRGATAYFGVEIEIVPLAATNPAGPLRLLMNMAGHLMAHGAHLRDGQPIRITGERPMRVALIPPGTSPTGAPRPGAIRLVPDPGEAE